MRRAAQPDHASPAGPTGYFDALAGLYAQHRPGYPDEAIAFILQGLPEPAQAADIGCGTGISTRLLAGHGARVIGVDPSERMLAEARSFETRSASNRSDDAALRGSIEYRMGTGEQTRLPDHHFDLLLCAQSFHWFDPPAALREFHRVLKPRGPLALMWNIKDDRDEFSARFNDVSRRAQDDAARRGLVVPEERATDAARGGLFRIITQRDFPNPQVLDWAGLLGRARSASYWPKADPVRGELERELGALFERHARDGTVRLNHNTQVTLAQPAT